jgi:hypothetical protein
LDEDLVYLHYSAVCLMAFMLFLLAGSSIQVAYFAATGTANPRNAYRWLNKIMDMLPILRTGLPLQPATIVAANNLHRACLGSTTTGLMQHFGVPFIPPFQQKRQRSFICY